ncbi:hypothetical protein ACSBR2_037823 [Camellia fascicularis]
MGVAKAWRLSGGMLSNLAVVNQQKKQHFWWRLRVSWSVVCGFMLFGLGLISLFTGHVASDLEWYSHRLVKRKLYYKLDGGSRAPIDIWKSKFSKFYYECSERGPHFAPVIREQFSNGYLLIATSGGLNQQRTGITDAVVVARILNATLVVPQLDHHSFWKDDSDFPNIFDVNWFISTLTKDVTIVKRVPDKVMRSMEKPPYSMRVPRKSEPEYYLDQVLPILLRRRVVQLTKFDYRLANNLDEELQKLRCRVNYHALRFTKPIRDLGQKLVSRMWKMTNRFIAIHLRRYMGHKRTIRPNAKKLSSLFMARDKMDWDTFARKVKSCQRGFMGEPEEVRPGRDEFIEYPSSCICQKPVRYSNDSDGNQTSKEGAIVSETNFARRSYNGDDQGVKSLQKPNKTIIMRKGPVSLAGDNCQ